MDLIINSPRQKKQLQITWVEFDTPDRNMIIQPQHAPMIVRLKENSEILYNVVTGKKEVVKITSGIVHITRDSVSIFASEIQ